MNISDVIYNEVQSVAAILVNEVLEEVENLQRAKENVSEDLKDGIDEEISLQWDRLCFCNVKLQIPGMPNEELAGIAGALAKEIWKDEVKSLLGSAAVQPK